MYEKAQLHSRTRMVLPLRLWLDEQAGETAPCVLAHTVDISEVGCRIGGLRTELSPGQIITIQRGHQKAPFRVIWSRRLAPNENQVGVEAADHKTNLWAFTPPPANEAIILSEGVAVIPRSVVANGIVPNSTVPNRVVQNSTVPNSTLSRSVVSSTVGSATVSSSNSSSSNSSSSTSAPSGALSRTTTTADASSGRQRTNARSAEPSKASSSASGTGPNLITGPRRYRRLIWGLGLGALMATVVLGVFLYHHFYQRFFTDSQSAQIEPLSPVPPSADELARLTPKAHPMPAALTQPLGASTSRLLVAEAPKGRVVYPVPPDDSLTGRVRLEIIIAADGLVKQIHVLSGKQPLAEAAARAVRMWRYGALPGPDPAAERETSVTVSFLGGDAVSLQFPRSTFPVEAARSRNN